MTTFLMRVFCVAVIIGSCWLFGEVAITAVKDWWRRQKHNALADAARHDRIEVGVRRGEQ